MKDPRVIFDEVVLEAGVAEQVEAAMLVDGSADPTAQAVRVLLQQYVGTAVTRQAVQQIIRAIKRLMEDLSLHGGQVFDYRVEDLSTPTEPGSIRVAWRTSRSSSYKLLDIQLDAP